LTMTKQLARKSGHIHRIVSRLMRRFAARFAVGDEVDFKDRGKWYRGVVTGGSHHASVNFIMAVPVSAWGRRPTRPGSQVDVREGGESQTATVMHQDSKNVFFRFPGAMRQERVPLESLVDPAAEFTYINNGQAVEIVSVTDHYVVEAEIEGRKQRIKTRPEDLHPPTHNKGEIENMKSKRTKQQTGMPEVKDFNGFLAYLSEAGLSSKTFKSFDKRNWAVVRRGLASVFAALEQWAGTLYKLSTGAMWLGPDDRDKEVKRITVELTQSASKALSGLRGLGDPVDVVRLVYKFGVRKGWTPGQFSVYKGRELSRLLK